MLILLLFGLQFKYSGVLSCSEATKILFAPVPDTLNEPKYIELKDVLLVAELAKNVVQQPKSRNILQTEVLVKFATELVKVNET